VAPTHSLIGLFVVPLERAGIEYMVTGGLAAIVYGHPRLTLDVDLVLRMPSTSASTFTALWPAGEFYVPPVEVVAEECARPGAGHCNVIHSTTMLRADVYFAGDDALAAWALGRRVVREVQGAVVQFAPIEYVILSKLRYFRDGGSDRHLRDIARMLEVSGPEVDRATLKDWVERLALEREWRLARAADGEH
jgi:hypothetical protein